MPTAGDRPPSPPSDCSAGCARPAAAPTAPRPAARPVSGGATVGSESDSCLAAELSGTRSAAAAPCHAMQGASRSFGAGLQVACLLGAGCPQEPGLPHPPFCLAARTGGSAAWRCSPEGPAGGQQGPAGRGVATASHIPSGRHSSTAAGRSWLEICPVRKLDTVAPHASTQEAALSRQAGRQAGRWAGRQTGGQAGRPAGRQALTRRPHLPQLQQTGVRLRAGGVRPRGPPLHLCPARPPPPRWPVANEEALHERRRRPPPRLGLPCSSVQAAARGAANVRMQQFCARLCTVRLAASCSRVCSPIGNTKPRAAGAMPRAALCRQERPQGPNPPRSASSNARKSTSSSRPAAIPATAWGLHAARSWRAGVYLSADGPAPRPFVQISRTTRRSWRRPRGTLKVRS